VIITPIAAAKLIANKTASTITLEYQHKKELTDKQISQLIRDIKSNLLQHKNTTIVILK
tara:strand:+ start:1372 stop:1548 length:177 start_codon:yes stop_codon:yes gene_type:complete